MDQKAKDILLKTYWTEQGLNPDPEISAEDFAYAKAQGLMFDPLTINEQELYNALAPLVENISQKKITDAFLSSFSTQRPYWRSAWASYVNAKDFLEVFHVVDFRHERRENEDLNILSFERLIWGGTRHDAIVYNLLDLQLFVKDEIPDPSKEDLEIFRQVLTVIAKSAPKDKPSALAENLKDALKVSRQEARTLIEILSCVGILQALDENRSLPENIDWQFALHWRGEDGYNKEKVKMYFGEYGIE